MQGAFNLVAKGDLSKFKKWLDSKGLSKDFRVEYNSDSELELGDSCNLSAMGETFIQKMFEENPEV